MFKQKHIRFDRMGDKLEVIIRDANWNPIYKKEVNIHDKQELQTLLKDLKNKGIDLLAIIKNDLKQEGHTEWFD